MLKILWGFVIGITIGVLIGSYDPNRVTYKDLENCRDGVATYRDALNDPHHCVSIVVEALEGKYNETSKN